MDQSKFKKYLRATSVLALLLVIVWIGYTVYDHIIFRVVSTNPASHNMTAVTPFFDIKFNKSLSGSGLSISSTPNIISTYKVSGKTLDISLNVPLQLTQTYIIRITHISALGGKHINNLQYTFKPRDILSNALPQDQKQALLNKQSEYSQTVGNDPLTQLLPFVGPDSGFKIDYTVRDNKGVAQLIILITAPTQQGQQDALSQLRTFGFNPSGYTINYVTEPVEP